MDFRILYEEKISGTINMIIHIEPDPFLNMEEAFEFVHKIKDYIKNGLYLNKKEKEEKEDDKNRG